MDLYAAMRELYDEKRRLDSAIAKLEASLVKKAPKGRRGRKHMSAEERLRVAERMRAYWQAKRSSGQAGSAASA